jgi:hypothetical protein
MVDRVNGDSHLPATDTEQEANHVGLLLLLDLFHVLEGTHLESCQSQLIWRDSRDWRESI